MVNWRLKHPNYYTDYYNKMFDQLRQQFGGKCAHCGSTDELQFAHIKETNLSGRGRGKKERYYDIRNHPDSYVLLSKKCHYEFDTLSPEIREQWLKNGSV